MLALSPVCCCYVADAAAVIVVAAVSDLSCRVTVSMKLHATNACVHEAFSVIYDDGVA